jgi:hypothetical protein
MHPRISPAHTRENHREGNVPEARLAVTCSGEDLSKERDFSAAYMEQSAEYTERLYTTHLADIWVLPPRLASQGLGGFR